MTARLEDKLFATFKEGSDLASLLLRLLDAQKRDWPDLRNNYDQLDRRQTRALSGKGAGRLMLQCNPARIGSTLAKVDSQSLKARKCFLCVENLPVEQKCVFWRGNYLVLCNPFPIFDRHYTVSRTIHTPQDIAASLTDFLALAADMGPDFTVFYNGPQCGASAPDHLHFQACPSGILPVETEELENNPPVLRSDGWEINVADITGRGVILVKATDIGPAREASTRVVSALRPAGSPSEPLLNMISWKENDNLKIAVFPRRKFRPDCFFLDGEARIAVSPAAVELGGLIVTPFQKDFDGLDFDAVVSILKEVSLDGASIIGLLKKFGS